MLFVPLVAQPPTVDGLLDADWKVRNATARALLAVPAEQLDVDGLLRVLRTEWDGEVPSFGRYGGRGGRRPSKEPRDRVWMELQVAQRCSGWWWHRPEPALDHEAELGVPWHPHPLAAFVIETRARSGGMPDVDIEVTDGIRARVWLRLTAPTDADLMRALAEERRGALIAGVLFQHRRIELLRDALAAGDPATAHNLLAIDEPELLARDDGLAVAANLVIHDDDDEAAAHVRTLLARCGRRGFEALAAALATTPDDRRAVARVLPILCSIDAGTSGHAIAVAYLDDEDRDLRHQALFLLGREDLPQELQEPAATRLMALVEHVGRLDLDTRLLAFDALGRCGAGVSQPQRNRLRAMLETPPAPFVKARVLGCLRSLGEADGVAVERRRYLATTVFPNTATWMALADGGAEGVQTLSELLLEAPYAIDTAEIAQRLAATAPEVLRAWLTGDEVRLRRLAIRALRSIEPDSGVPTAQLLSQALSETPVDDAWIEWLATRDDLGDRAVEVFACMAKQSVDVVPASWQTFTNEHRPPTERLLELLDPLLRRGVGWELLGDDSPELVRQACMAHASAASRRDDRARLAAVIARMGAATEQEVALVQEALASKHRDLPLDALEHAPVLASALRPQIEKLLSARDGWTRNLARMALIAHPEPR
ncbi:MAG: hypothetical protein R3F29_12210 [Planctomycetota bacterium]